MSYPIERMVRVVLTCCFALSLEACAGCVDPMGLYGERVTLYEIAEDRYRPKDDRLEEKRPVFVEGLEVQERFGDCDVMVNKSGSIARLHIGEFKSDERELEGKLFRNRGEALAALKRHSKTEVLPSMEVVNGKLKPFNDGFYAAVELAAQNGLPGGFIGKGALLKRLLEAAVAEGDRPENAPYRAALSEAAAFLEAALALGREEPDVARLSPTAAALVGGFLSNPQVSRPIAFYTWTPALSGIFRQDRFLHYGPSDESAIAIALLLKRNPELLDAYQTANLIFAGMTGRPASATLDALIGRLPASASFSATADSALLRYVAELPARSACEMPALAFLSSSTAKDNEFVCECIAKDICDNVMNRLIEAIRGGDLSLEPDERDGWYARQVYALETLLAPEKGAESHHLFLTAAYKEKLIESFKSIMTQIRETHQKQLGGSRDVSASIPPFDYWPNFPVEPFPTFYQRTAWSYLFVRAFVDSVLGSDFLAAQRRLLPSGEHLQGASLADELDERIALLFGLQAVSNESLGMPVVLAGAPEALELTAVREAAKSWLGRWETDADVLEDPRVVNHLGCNRRGCTYWAVLGVKVYRMDTKYMEGYEPKYRSVGSPCAPRSSIERSYYLLLEETTEFLLPYAVSPPTRDEFRALCDRLKTKAAILGELNP